VKDAALTAKSTKKIFLAKAQTWEFVVHALCSYRPEKHKQRVTTIFARC
jgi:hypothetical protein